MSGATWRHYESSRSAASIVASEQRGPGKLRGPASGPNGVFRALAEKRLSGFRPEKMGDRQGGRRGVLDGDCLAARVLRLELALRERGRQG